MLELTDMENLFKPICALTIKKRIDDALCLGNLYLKLLKRHKRHKRTLIEGEGEKDG